MLEGTSRKRDRLSEYRERSDFPAIMTIQRGYLFDPQP
jgi:hypothetical protein